MDRRLNCLALAVTGAWLAAAVPAPAPAPAPAAEPGQAPAWADPDNPIAKLWGGERLDLWSLRPPSPDVFPPAPGAHPIDRLLGIGLSSKLADRRSLARRLYLDLTGLPPSPEAVDAFERDPAPDAWERCVDRCLSSPRYGEHQARLWLDVIRYSDSNGFDWDEFRKQAWRFRDYAIRSFNADKPFDRFILEQLAGDELLDGLPRTPADQDCLVATGYLRLGPHDNAAPLFNEQDRSRNELMSDLVETTGSAFLGLTLSCCRCHDHKTDPLSQADHYRLRAFFEGVKFADDLAIDLAEEQEAIRRHNAAIDDRAKPLESERDAILGRVRQRLREERLARLNPEERSLLDLPKDKRPEDLQGRIEGIERKVQPSDKEVNAAVTGADKKRREAIDAELIAIRRERRDETHALLMTDAPGEPGETRILFQGNHKSPRDPVKPGFPSVLDPRPATLSKATNPKTTGRRLTLARWIASPANPLTARVFVNRIWQQHFGEGLVTTPNDFGYSGSRPSNPVLLDWLATDFVAGGWSIKRLHRQIATSTAYRLVAHHGTDASGGASTQPVGFHRRPRRLSAEQLRDALLAAAGTLNSRAGGPPVWPELPSEILSANPAFLDDNETRTKGWYPSPLAEQAVRSVYLVQKRTVRVPFMETFDLPENSTSCARRTDSTVAPQALSLMNGALASEAARDFARRIEREAGPRNRDRIELAFRIAIQRSPTPEELVRCEEFLGHRTLPELCRALLNLNEFVYVD